MPRRSPGLGQTRLPYSGSRFARTSGGLWEMEVRKNTVVENTFFCYNITLWSIMNNYGMEERV